MKEIPGWAHGVAFTVAQGRAFGLTDARLRSPVLGRPFHGVRVFGSDGRREGGGLLDRCADLRVAYAGELLFTHATAARLWGMPIPRELADDLHVLVPGRTAVRRPGVIGWVRPSSPPQAALAHGIPVTSPADTWSMLATMSAARGGTLSREWLVAIGDFLVSGARTRKGREPALASLDELSDAVSRHGSRRGAESLAWALPRIRTPVDSPQESLLRLGLVRERLPEPVVQPPIRTAVGARHPDLGYLEENVLIEYLGDVHRTDKRTWRGDLTRVQLFEDAGYRVMLASADDVAPDGIAAFAARVLRARQARPRP